MILKSTMKIIFKFLNQNLYFLLLILKNVHDIIYKFYIYWDIKF